jgi:hypothetical protein
MYLFSPDGIINAAQLTTAPTLEGSQATPTEQTQPQEEIKPEVEEETSVETVSEVKAFMKWASKGKRARLFEFKTLDPIVGEALNRCAFDGDLETAKALAKAYLT